MKHTRILAITAAVMLMASPVLAADSKTMTKSETAAAVSAQPAAGKKHHHHHHHHHHMMNDKHMASGDARMAGDHHNTTMHRHKHDTRKAGGPVHRSVRSSPGYSAHRGGADGAGGWTAQ